MQHLVKSPSVTLNQISLKRSGLPIPKNKDNAPAMDVATIINFFWKKIARTPHTAAAIKKNASRPMALGITAFLSNAKTEIPKKAPAIAPINLNQDNPMGQEMKTLCRRSA